MVQIRIERLVIVLVAAADIFRLDVGFLVFPRVSVGVHKGFRNGILVFRHVVHTRLNGIVIYNRHAVRPDSNILGMYF